MSAKWYTGVMDIEHIKQWLGAGSINIFGRPFAGKDTQGKLLVDLVDGVMLGSGEILRNSHIPPHVADIMYHGGLVPSEDFVDIVLPYLSKEEFRGKPLILSSVGRWIGEEQGVMRALEASAHPLRAVIYLDIPEDYVRDRWQAISEHTDRSGRQDDSPGVLEHRLEEYREKTIPVIETYEKLGLLIRIDGTRTPEEVHRQIVSRLNELAAK